MKKLWMVFPALLVMTGMVLTGCGNGSTDTPAAPTGDITWTLDQKGGAGEVGQEATATTTDIVIEFSADVATLPTARVQILTTERASKKTGTQPVKVPGTTKWEIPIDVTEGGDIQVMISNLPGVETATKSTKIFLLGEMSRISWNWSVNGAAGTATTSAITITFDAAVADLQPSEVTVATIVGNPGRATKGTLTGSGVTWTQNIVVTAQGKVRVTITKEGIDTASKDVDIYLEEVVGPPDIPADGVIGIFNATTLPVDPSDDDPVKEAENTALGKGVITGDDFDAIVDATAYKDTFLRLYLDLTEYTDTRGWGCGALGNLLGDDGEPSGDANLGFNSPTTGGDYPSVDVTLKALKSFYDVDDGEIFVNIWSGAKIRAIKLFVPTDPEEEEELEEGVHEFTLVETDDTPGKGFFVTPDVALLNAAKPGSYLRLFVKGNTKAVGEGFGVVITNGWAGKLTLEVPAGESDTFEFDVLVADIKYALLVRDYNEGLKWANGTITASVGFNLYDGAHLTKLLLIEPNDGEDLPPPDLPPPPDFIPIGNLGDYTFSNNASQKGWGADGTDNEPGPEGSEWAAAKYIVLKVTELTNPDGLGGLQYTHQGVVNWTWRDFTAISADWTGFSNVEEDITYVVIDLSSIDSWTTALATYSNGGMKFFLGGIDQFTLLGAWLLADNPLYTKPGTATNLSVPTAGDDTNVSHGYLVKEADFDWNLPGDE